MNQAKHYKSYFLIKAYLPDGTLIKSKPVSLRDINAYWHLVADCRLLGCKGYYLKTPSVSKFISFPTTEGPLISIRSFLKGCAI